MRCYNRYSCSSKGSKAVLASRKDSHSSWTPRESDEKNAETSATRADNSAIGVAKRITSVTTDRVHGHPLRKWLSPEDVEN